MTRRVRPMRHRAAPWTARYVRNLTARGIKHRPAGSLLYRSGR